MILDLERNPESPEDVRPDVIVSAMTLHHIADTARFAATLHALLPAGASIAIVALDTESGDFHADNTGVEHFGFDRDELGQQFSSAGFEDIRFTTAYDFVRPGPDGEKSFPLFLLYARKT